MTVFWLVAGLFLLGALLMLLPGLLRGGVTGAPVGDANLAVHGDQLREARRDLAAGLLSEDRFAQTRAEIVRRLVEDTAPAGPAVAPGPARRTAWALAVLIPLASVALYWRVGDPAAIAPRLAPADRHGVSPQQIQKLATALGERLQARPDDAQGWLMLGRSYTALSRYRDAATAFRRAIALLPPDAGLLADLADVLGMANNRRLAGEPARLVQQALDLDPRHEKALALAGSVSFEARDFVAARAHWQRLLAVLPPDSPMARSVQGSLQEAQKLEGGDAEAAGAAGPVRVGATAGTSAAAAETAGQPVQRRSVVSGQVIVSPALADRIAAGDTLFVFARAAQGPRMPLAILRRAASDQAVNFTLDDAMAMAPSLKLSGFDQVVVGARISRSGNATPQAGDLVGQSAPVRPGTEGLRIVIDQLQP